jgi:hypothetical protein
LRVGLSTLFRSFWRSDSSVGCRTVSGGGVRVDGALTVGSSAGSASMLFSYNAFVPKPAAGSVGNMPSSGQTLVTVAGSGAGSFGYSVKAVVGKSACGGTVWRAESSVLCRTSSGVGKGLLIVASVLLARGSAGEFFSYDAFSGSSVSPMNTPSTGGVRLSVVGSGLGSAWYSVSLQVGGSAGVGMVWRSDSCMIAKAPPGVGGSRTVVSSVSSGPGALSGAVSYDVPVVSFAMPGRVPGSGSSVVVVRGRGYGVSYLS